MVKPGSQRQGIPKKIEGEKKNRRIFGEINKKNEGKANVVESHRQAALQWENTKTETEKSYKKG